jgi:hypothetical protein
MRLRELPAEERDAFRTEKGERDRELDDIGDPVPAASRPGGGDEPASPANDSVSQPRAGARAPQASATLGRCKHTWAPCTSTC